jgi:hypothetical protein
MIDTSRHLSVFSAYAFGDRRIDVIGCGATGSRIALSLAKLGIKNIHVWDFDIVAKENIPNQAFGQNHIGLKKVIALADLIFLSTGLQVTTHDERVDGTQVLGDVVFLLTDKIESRREIWEKGIKNKLRTKLMIETRMGIDVGRIYTVKPIISSLGKAWESSLRAPAQTSPTACRASVSVGPTAEIVSGLAVWQFMRWFSIENGTEDELENEIIFSVRPESNYLANKF